MSSQFCVSLDIECRPSRRLSLLYALLFGGAVLGTGIADIPVLLKASVFIILAAGAMSVSRRHILLLSPRSVLALRRSAEEWTVHTRDGSSRPARLIAAAFWVFDIIPLLFSAADGRRFTVLLAPDNVQPEALRELRAWVRHRLPAA